MHGGNLLCVVGEDHVRCAIRHRFWTIPGSGKRCQSGWAAGVIVNGDKAASPFCINATVRIGANVPEVKPGYDDAVGNAICEVRSFAVDCFVSHHHGFLLSRTGYALY